MNVDKPKVIKDYDKLDQSVLNKLTEVYPWGFSGYLMTYTNNEGKEVKALPLETESYSYLIRVNSNKNDSTMSLEDEQDEDNSHIEISNEEMGDAIE
ncbi:MAG: hypothetical protein JXQ96_10865 [Cyclobacteriaceae bacterium]